MGGGLAAFVFALGFRLGYSFPLACQQLVSLELSDCNKDSQHQLAVGILSVHVSIGEEADVHAFHLKGNYGASLRNTLNNLIPIAQ